MVYLLYLFIGLIAGVAGGFFGIGGAIIIIPLLVFSVKFPQHLAQGTSLAALLLPVGALAVWRYWKGGNVDIWCALAIATGFFIGGWFGADLAHKAGSATLQRAFGALLVALGIKLLLGKS